MPLIDLNTVLEEIEDTVTSVSFCGTVEAARSAHETKDRILSRIKELPTIDAAPVVHGRWDVVDDAEPRRYGCSVCRTLSWYGVYNYCPNCGAKMDLKEEQNGTDNP